MSEWKRSGLERNDFARREGIPPSKLAWWVGRLRTLGSQEEVAAVPSLGFVELVAPTTGVGVELVLRGGAVLRVPVGFDDTTLARVLRVVDGAAP